MNSSKIPEKPGLLYVMDEDPYVSSGDDKPEVRQSTIARLLLSNRMTRPEISCADVPSTAEDSGLGEVPTITLDGDSSQDQQYMVNYEAARSDFESARSVKALKCPLCDYSTNDKSNFRRHKRLHLRNNPVNVLKCDKCTYSTILPRKIREHYCEEHKEVPNSTVAESTIGYSVPSYGETRFSFRHFGVDQNNSANNPLGVSTLHTLLTTVQSPNLQFRRSGQTPIGNCFTQYNHYESAGQQANPDTHLASNYLRSIVSSIINTPPPPPPPPRVPVTSTITSSGLYSAAVSSVTPALPSTTVPHLSLPASTIVPNETDSAAEVRVKIEPYECEDISDVSSSAAATPMRTVTPDCTRDLQTTLSTSQRTPKEYETSVASATPYTMSADAGQLAEGEQSNLNLADSSNNRVDYRLNENSIPNENVASTSLLSHYSESLIHSSSNLKNLNGEPSSVSSRNSVCDNSSLIKSFSQDEVNVSSVKMETSSVAVQCALPSVKTEGCSTEQDETPERKSWRNQFTDRAVQCELLPSRRTGSRSLSLASESEGSEQPSTATMTDNRCNHCGVTFEDEVLFSIHIGCHSHTDPFVCNVCGKQCCNKYGFYSHIMRGHQYV